MSNIFKGLNENRSSWDSNMPGYQGDYGGAENWGRRNKASDENDAIDARLRQQHAQRQEYEKSGKFWLKLKDTQRHLPAGPFTGKQAANTAALELLKQQPELKGNLVITAYGPDETQDVAEAEQVDSPKFQSAVSALKQMAKQGERKTVWDPVKRVYKTVPVNTPKKEEGVAEGSDYQSYLDKYSNSKSKKPLMTKTEFDTLQRKKEDDKKYKRVNGVIVGRKGVAEGINDDFEQAHHNEVERYITAHGTPGEYSHKYDDMGNAHNSYLTYPGRTVTINTQQYGDRFGHNVFTKKDKEVDEGYDKWGWHTSLTNGEFMPTKYGNKNYVYLHDMDNQSANGNPQLVTFNKLAHAKKAAAQFGGKVVKTDLNTYRIVKPAEQGVAEAEDVSHLHKALDRALSKEKKASPAQVQRNKERWAQRQAEKEQGNKDMKIDELAINEDWQKVNKKDKTDGMSRKAVKAYRRENPGSKLQTAVTTKPSKLKKGSKSAKRRKSFCARMKGMKKAHASAKTKRDPDSPINKALRRWNCESIEQMQELVMIAEAKIAEAKNAKQQAAIAINMKKAGKKPQGN